MNIKRSIIQFLRKEDGPTAVECALMLALMVVICIVAMNTVQPANPAQPTAIVVEVQDAAK